MKKIKVIIGALLLTVAPSCTILKPGGPVSDLNAFAGDRTVLGAEVEVLGIKKVGAGVWVKDVD
tara:strand:- start:2265 stop:2456 length:192 start_codon:yes stop_codon:yes gene_type:complete